MKRLKLTFSASVLLALSACGGNAQTDTEEVANDYAARINGGKQAPQGNVAPTVVPPRADAAQGAFAPGTATDPQSMTCNANKMGPFIGRPADDTTRLEVMSAAQGAAEVRFISPGGDFIRPDPTHPRLNLMLDSQGIIRDARCG